MSTIHQDSCWRSHQDGASIVRRSTKPPPAVDFFLLRYDTAIQGCESLTGTPVADAFAVPDRLMYNARTSLMKGLNVPNIQELAEQTNRQRWDELAPIHARAYQEVQILKQGGCVLDELEVDELGDVTGKTLLHLQCHIGTDSLAWARRGAIVTGVDFSADSVAEAQILQQELGLDATFIHSNVYDLPQVLETAFDIVYTSRGVLCWLRDLEEWANIVSHFLKPGGTLYLMDSHPFLHIFEEVEDQPGELAITYPYFHEAAPTYWQAGDTDYADDTYAAQNPSYEWQWSVGDILSALLNAGLRLESFEEHERLFFKIFPGMEEHSDRWYWLPQHAGRLPMIFTLRARKPDRG